MIIRKAISLDLQFFENPIFYDTLQDARRQADTSALAIVRSTLQMAQQTITPVSLIALLLRFSPWLAVIVFVAAGPSFLSQSQSAERAIAQKRTRAWDGGCCPARLLRQLRLRICAENRRWPDHVGRYDHVPVDIPAVTAPRLRCCSTI